MNVGAAVAAGTESAFVPTDLGYPTGADGIQVSSVEFILNTGAAVANRIPVFIFDEVVNSTEVFRVAAATAQPASTSVRYSLVPGYDGSTATVNGAAVLPLPQPLFMAMGTDKFPVLAPFRLRTLTTALQAADQWLAPRALVFAIGTQQV